MFCPNCGNQVPDGYSFCSYCGAQFDNSYVNQQPQYPYPQPQYQQPQYAVQQEPPKKGVNLMGVIAGVAALLVAGGIAAGIFFFGGRNGDGNTQDKPDSGNYSQDKDENADVQEEDHFSGWVVSAKWEYDGEGVLLRGEKNSYDLLGRLDKGYYCNSEGEPYQCNQYEYDMTGGYTVTNYSIADGRTHTFEQYDSDGQNILRIVYNEDGTERERFTYVFYAKDKPLSQEFFKVGAPAAEWRYEYTYDSQGNQTSMVYYTNGSEVRRVEMAYDSAGHMIREQKISNQKDPSEDPDIYEYTYDAQGNLVYMMHTYCGVPYDHEEYYYDSENRLILYREYSHSYKGNIEMQRFEQYIYNEQGLLISEGYGKSYDDSLDAPPEKCFRERTLYEYRTDGQLTHIRRVTSDSLLKEEFIYTYDENGCLRTECRTTENNELGIAGHTVDESTYDEHGNMISKKGYYDNGTLKYHHEYEYTFIP